MDFTIRNETKQMFIISRRPAYKVKRYPSRHCIHETNRNKYLFAESHSAQMQGVANKLIARFMLLTNTDTKQTDLNFLVNNINKKQTIFWYSEMNRGTVGRGQIPEVDLSSTWSTSSLHKERFKEIAVRTIQTLMKLPVKAYQVMHFLLLWMTILYQKRTWHLLQNIVR